MISFQYFFTNYEIKMPMRDKTSIMGKFKEFMCINQIYQVFFIIPK